ncbi:hypothetical protein BLNAU_5107 [Blattamonas nauphoetae]|uniref:Uncharacterized protein n=1 Tax=Blattamonas nauphoetae TaxID=2049346 RepID=A0ABQ9Y839_9EUKA|nr:hypothetical protein BLNAU_5107 [Blattamonas nauphoetae]
MSPSADYACSDCSAFLNWDEKELETECEKGVVFRSLVATVKLQPAFHDSLEAKAVKFLQYVVACTSESADAFLSIFGRTTPESLTNFVQCIGMLVSSPSKIIATTAMKIVGRLILYSSPKILHTLINADLIPQIIISLNPLSLSFAEAEDIHKYLIDIITKSIRLAALESLAYQGTNDDNELQTVHETILQK